MQPWREVVWILCLGTYNQGTAGTAHLCLKNACNSSMYLPIIIIWPPCMKFKGRKKNPPQTADLQWPNETFPAETSFLKKNETSKNVYQKGFLPKTEDLRGSHFHSGLLLLNPLFLFTSPYCNMEYSILTQIYYLNDQS